jgi:sn-glycerol 3-phosphate transport system permease protein
MRSFAALRTTSAVTPWLLLLPALTLLVAFTHWPAVATVWDRVFSTAKKGGPSHFIGLENYRSMFKVDVFWQ